MFGERLGFGPPATGGLGVSVRLTHRIPSRITSGLVDRINIDSGVGLESVPHPETVLGSGVVAGLRAPLVPNFKVIRQSGVLEGGAKPYPNVVELDPVDLILALPYKL